MGKLEAKDSPAFNAEPEKPGSVPRAREVSGRPYRNPPSKSIKVSAEWECDKKEALYSCTNSHFDFIPSLEIVETA